MAKTYTAVPTVAAGDVYTASAYNTYTSTNVSNLIVPPMVRVKRTSNLTSYTSGTNITWQATDGMDTDGMWSSGTNIVINTAGVYVVSFVGRIQFSTAPTYVLATITGTPTNIWHGVPGVTSTDYRFAVTGFCNLTATTNITANVEFSGGSAPVIDGSVLFTNFSACWIGRTS